MEDELQGSIQRDNLEPTLTLGTENSLRGFFNDTVKFLELNAVAFEDVDMSDHDAVVKVLKTLDITQKKHMVEALLTKEQRDKKEADKLAVKMAKSEKKAADKVSTAPVPHLRRVETTFVYDPPPTTPLRSAPRQDVPLISSTKQKRLELSRKPVG